MDLILASRTLSYEEVALYILSRQCAIEQQVYNIRYKRKNTRKLLDLSSLSDEEVCHNFRFNRDHIIYLANKLLPDYVPVKTRIKVTGLEALLIVLRRFAYPNRWMDLYFLFGRHPAQLSNIFNAALWIIYQRYDHLLLNFEQSWITNNMETFSNAIHRKGAPLQNCWGFIDGTVRGVCRPIRDQKLIYNGHKRVHALKYQFIQAPNGLIANLEGPFHGRRHDAHLLHASETLDKLRHLNGGMYCIYGDPAYPLREQLMTGFRGENISEDEEIFNKRMNRCRQTVEWGIGKVIQLWAFLDFKKNNKVLLQDVGLYYRVGVFLTNLHTIFYKCQTSRYYGVDPPTVEEYLG